MRLSTGTERGAAVSIAHPARHPAAGYDSKLTSRDEVDLLNKEENYENETIVIGTARSCDDAEPLRHNGFCSSDRL